MSGNYYDFSDYQLDEIIEDLENTIHKATMPRPPKVEEWELWQVSRLYKRFSYGQVYLPIPVKTRQQAIDYINRQGWRITGENEGGINMEDGTISYRFSKYTPYADGEIYPDYKAETIEELRKALMVLKQAKVYIRRLNYLFDGDDSEESFLERTEGGLRELSKN